MFGDGKKGKLCYNKEQHDVFEAETDHQARRICP
jgi:hypothetical protein